MPKTDLLRRIDLAELSGGSGAFGGSINLVEGAAGAGALMYNYIIYEGGGICTVVNGLTGTVDQRSSDYRAAIQYAIDAAGAGGSLAFRPGNYPLSAELRPKSRQTWWLSHGVIFAPTGNNRIINATNVEWWTIYGTLHIKDTAHRSTSVEAILLDGVRCCYFQHILIWDYYNGITLRGIVTRAFENIFVHVYMAVIRNQGFAIWGEVGDNEFHSVFVKGPSTTQWATGAGLVIGLYPWQGTIFGGLMFQRVEILDFHVNVDLQGLYEVWIGQLLSDNAYWAALYIGDRVQRLFVDRVWASGSGDGVWIQGSADSFAQRLYFNQIFAWVNAQYGMHINGWVRDVYIGSLYLLENQVTQLRFARGQNRNIAIGQLTVAKSNRMAVDSGGVDGIDANVSIAHAELDNGECMGLDLLRHIDGTRNGKLFSNRGVAYIPAGQSFVVIPHGLEGRPLFVRLSPHHYEARQAFISAYDLTNFTIDAGLNVATTTRIAWEARTGVEIGNELLANPNVDIGNPPSNWTSSNGSVVENSDVYNGIRALRINGNFHEWKSAPFVVYPFARYRLRMYIKGVGNEFCALGIRWYDGPNGGGNLLTESALLLTSIHDYRARYVRIQGDYTAPYAAQSAVVVFRNAAANTTDVWGDDFFLGLPAGTNLLANASVENGESVPNNWQLRGITWESGIARTGNRSLRVINSSNTKEAKANWVSVTGGRQYETSVWLKGQASGNVALVVQWYSDAGGIGNLIREDMQYFTGTFADWTRVSANFTAPLTAQSAYLLWRMVGWRAYDLKGDAFSVRHII